MSSSLGIECPSTPEHLDLPPTPDRNDVQDLNSPSQASDQEADETPSSPPPNCAICLGQCRNKSFTDSCLHQFCFKCLLEWSKVKAECPLCKQAFKSIIHNVRSIDQFDEHLVHPQQSILQRLDFLLSEPPRFRFSATLQVGPSENEAIQRFFAPTGNRFVQPYRFRQLVYTNHLYAEPLTDITGRYRECSARFYRDNPAQMHRLMPFISREARSLLGSEEQSSSAVSQILVLLTLHDITSPGFRSRIRHIFGENTDHFIHELFNFAQAPYDLIGYDNHVRYVGRNGATSGSEVRRPLNIPLSVSAPYDTDDSMRMMVPPSEVAPPPASQSSGQASAARDVRNSVIFQLGRNIEISSTSESDSDDCQFVLELKPPHLRTPELVSLNSESDSDVVFVEESRKSPKPAVVEVQAGPSVDTPVASSSSATQTPLTTMPLIPKLRIRAFHTAQARICHSDDTDKEEVKPSGMLLEDEGSSGSLLNPRGKPSSSRRRARRARPTKRLSSSSSQSSDSSSDESSTSTTSCENRVSVVKKRKHTMSTTSTSDSSSLDESSHEEFMVSSKARKKVKRFANYRKKHPAREEDSTDGDTKMVRKTTKAGKRRKAERRVYKRITNMRRARKIPDSDD